MNPIRVATAAPSPQSRAVSTRRPWLVMFLAGQGQPSFHRRSPTADAPSPLRRAGGKVYGALIQSLRCISPALRYAPGNVIARKSAVNERVRDVLLPFRKVSHEHSIRHGKRSQQHREPKRFRPIREVDVTAIFKCEELVGADV